MNDTEFIAAFEQRTLPFGRWTHRAHVKMCYLYLGADFFDAALARIRTGIQAYNAANNVPETPTSGYNETTTVAFTHLVAAVMRAYAKTHPVTNADEFCDIHPQLMTKHALRFFYSPQQRMHPLAKTQFVEPDLAPLPRIG